MPEFGRAALDVLRQPLEDKIVTISRAQGSITYPANFMLVAAMNPCPCGYYGDPVKECTCNPLTVSRYQKRISGPLLDRIDMFADVPRVEYEKLAGEHDSESSDTVRTRVEKARDVQRERFNGCSNIKCNSDMTPTAVREFCKVEPSAQNLPSLAMKQFYLSARSFHRILKLARTIADLNNCGIIKANHLTEAIQYRPKMF